MSGGSSAIAQSSPYRFKAVLIDLDGTMVDSVPDLANAANMMLADLGREAWPVETIRTWVGNGVPRLVHRSLTGEFDGEADEELFEKAHEIFTEHYRTHLCVDSVCYAGVEQTIRHLHEAGLKLACVTNKPEALSVDLLSQLGIGNYFEVILGGDSLPTRKPDPEPILEAARRLGVAVDECVLIGDSKADVKSAHNAACVSICVAYGYNQGFDMKLLEPDYLVENFSEVLDCMHASV